MSLKGQTVRIIVSEPWDWEENLFGTILSDRGGDKLLVKLTKPINGKTLTMFGWNGTYFRDRHICHEKNSPARVF